MANVKGSKPAKRSTRAGKSRPTRSGRTSGALRLVRDERAYRSAVPGPAAAGVRADIDAAVRQGERIRQEIEALIEERFAAPPRRW